jgi:mannose-6-phosphate isomerase-like protein (cupin superfamily)
MQYMGAYQVLAHVETPEFSMRLLTLAEDGYVGPHYHHECKQVYAVLEGVVEATLGDRTFRLRPYGTTQVQRHSVHNVRAVGGPALVLSVSTPPLKLEDQHPVEYGLPSPATRRRSSSARTLSAVGG